jgi:signal transduction histidine kinase
MFKNLRTSTKLFILCSMFIILVGVTTYGLVAEKQIAIKFAGKELVGNQYLTVNAIEAMGSVTHRARLLLVKSEIHELDGVLITVQDSGIGIGPTETERIFDAFFTTKSDGMGMGLAISRSIIEAHGGRLWASPGTPHGSVFYFVLPSGRVSGE